MIQQNIYYILKLTCSFSLVLVTSYSYSQDDDKIMAGVNLAGVLLKTIDLELQYSFNPHLSAALSGGYQFKNRIPDLKNSENGRSSGSFVRTGIIFITSKPERNARYFLKGEFVYSYLQHETTIVFADYYEQFTLLFQKKSHFLGGAFGHGFRIYISDKFEAEIAGMLGFNNNKEDYVTTGYMLPGYYIGWGLFPVRANYFARPLFNIKYKFKAKSKSTVEQDDL